ncbi:MAG: hypothetical protein M0Q45_06690 [Bacteroidales bacterium]|jgi:H+/gluconate symporter-like permease|nr:hypothetical protein [Bacteroidales bacterium]MCK9499175.1 hypothetical protein [Bacteroidales bacterium]MDY0314448.1 hypothetical protein [Bacteroidales bacterium]
MDSNQNENINRGFAEPSNQERQSSFQNNYNFKINLPKSGAILSLGIISLASILCCGVFISPILAIIALALFPSTKKTYLAEPDLYKKSSYTNLKTGRTLAIIGLSVSVFFIIILLIIGAVSNESTEVLKEATEFGWDELGY